MPTTIAVASSSPRKRIVAARSAEEVNAPRKRKLRSDSAAEIADTAAMKSKSTRRCAVSIPETPKLEIKEDVISSVKNQFDPKDDDHMKAVKEALHVSKAPAIVVCREDEQRRVFEFVKDCMEEKKAGSLYICGCPGTGKSLSMEKVRQQVEDWVKQEGLPCLETVSVNCTSLTKTTDIFSKILGENETGRKASGSDKLLIFVKL